MENDQIARSVHELVRDWAPGLDSSASLADEMPLGSGGLEFDSVRVVELLLACEEKFQILIPAELLEGTSPTVGALVAWVRRGLGAPG